MLRSWFLVAVLVVVWGTACVGAAHASLAAEALAALGEQPPERSFTFIVWGDNRCRAGALGSPAFSRIIAEANALDVVFTVGVGDLIPGAREQQLDWTREQWDDFIAAVGHFRMPFFPVIGNHDLDGPLTSAIYEELIAPRRYAFDYGAARLIALDSEEEGGFSEEQFAWLRRQLAAGAPPDSIFLFLHQPLFYGPAWDRVHALLRQFPVRAVFGGHDHIYSYGQRDGIHYVVTGGAGAPLRDPVGRGGFFHYVVVNVRDGEVSLAVAREGAILPADCVRRSDFALLPQVLEAMAAPEVEAAAGEYAAVSAEARIRNPGDQAWDSALRWRMPGGWLVEPEAVRFSLAPGEEVALPFTIHVPAPLAARYPVPEMEVEYPAEDGKPLTFSRPLRLRSLLPCPRERFSPPQPVAVTPPLFFRAMPDDQSAAFQLRWDADALHMVVAVTDDIARHIRSGSDLWDGDSLQFYFDMADDGNARAHQADDHELCAARGVEGIQVWRYSGPADTAEGPMPAVKCDIADRPGGRTYHLSIPWAELTPFAPQPGAAFGFSMVVNDDDGLEAGGLTWLELTPGAGSGRKPFPLDRVVLE